MDYAINWLARRDMIDRAEISEGSRVITDPGAHTRRMVKRFGPEYQEAFLTAKRERRPDRCSAEVRRLVDEELSRRHGWKTLQEIWAEKADKWEPKP